MRENEWHSYQEGQPERTLHVYGPHMWHDDCFLVGSRPALEDLKRALDEALETGSGLSLASAADGEGFGVGVVLLDDGERWAELKLPYTGELAADKRELEERLTPILDSGDNPAVKLARFRRYRPEQLVRLAKTAGALNEAGLSAAICSHSDLGAARAEEVIDRLRNGESATVYTDSAEAALSLVAAAADLGAQGATIGAANDGNESSEKS